MTEDRLLTTEEAADFFNITPRRLADWKKWPTFPQPRKGPWGSSLRWRMSDIQDWIRELPALNASTSAP